MYNEKLNIKNCIGNSTHTLMSKFLFGIHELFYVYIFLVLFSENNAEIKLVIHKELLSIIKTLILKKSLGPDHITANMLKELQMKCIIFLTQRYF